MTVDALSVEGRALVERLTFAHFASAGPVKPTSAADQSQERLHR